jgi:hypothetical protein
MAERKLSGGELRKLLDYEEVVDTLQEKPGVWFRVFRGPVKSCATVRSRLQKFGCVVHTSPYENGVREVYAFWPEWVGAKNETSSVWE